jgi:hypothetical protein
MAKDLIYFSFRIKKIASAINRAVDLTAQDAARSALIEVIKNTPVDVGTARSNWVVGIGAPAIGARRPAFLPYRSRWRSPKGSGGSIGESANASAAFALGALKINSRKPDDPIYIENQVPYIERLDQGHSNQVRPGFVNRSVAVAASIASQRAVFHLKNEIG